ncbi:unnamed protein product, partial [Protopolystoma xenopodis]
HYSLAKSVSFNSYTSSASFSYLDNEELRSAWLQGVQQGVRLANEVAELFGLTYQLLTAAPRSINDTNPSMNATNSSLFDSSTGFNSSIRFGADRPLTHVVDAAGKLDRLTEKRRSNVLRIADELHRLLRALMLSEATDSGRLTESPICLLNPCSASAPLTFITLGANASASFAPSFPAAQPTQSAIGAEASSEYSPSVSLSTKMSRQMSAETPFHPGAVALTAVGSRLENLLHNDSLLTMIRTKARQIHSLLDLDIQTLTDSMTTLSF